MAGNSGVHSSPTHPVDNPVLALALAGRATEAVHRCLAETPSPTAAARKLDSVSLACIQAGRHDAAETLLNAAIHADGNSFPAHANLGALLMMTGRAAEAVPILQKAVDLSPPPKAQSLLNLGHALAAAARPDEALQRFRDAQTADPSNADAWCAEADILSGLGRLSEALDIYQRILAVKPDHLGAQANGGSVLNRLDRWEEALPLLYAAHRQAPGNAAILVTLGASLNETGRSADAMQCCERALALGATAPELHNNLGNALKSLGRNAEALPHFEQASSALAHDPKVWLNLGNTAMELGKTDQAERAYVRAIDCDPAQGRAHRALASVHRYSAHDPHLAMMTGLSADVETWPESSRMEFHFALGKALDDVGDAPAAFAQWELGNRLKRAQTPYDEAATFAHFDRIERVVSSAFIKARSEPRGSTRQPIFIIGMPRSGTTLVEQILSSVPGVAGLGERMDFQDCLAQSGGLSVAQEQNAQWFRALGDAYLASIAPDADGAVTTVDKMPANFQYAGLIHLALPGARLVHLRRDPIDTCLSCWSRLFTGDQPFTYNLPALGRYWRRYQRLMDHWRSVLPPSALLDVDYEALVADFPAQARRLLDFCGLPWTDDCLAFHRTQRVVRTASATQVRQPLYANAVGRHAPYAALLEPLTQALRQD